MKVSIFLLITQTLCWLEIFLARELLDTSMNEVGFKFAPTPASCNALKRDDPANARS